MATVSSSSPPAIAGEGEDEKVYVAVGKEAKEGNATLLWALQNFPKEKIFVVAHVHSPSNFVPTMGCRFPVSHLAEQVVNAFRKMEMQTVNDSLDEYMLLCAKENVRAEKLVAESDDITEGLIELISKHHVTTLVMGAAADKYHTKVQEDEDPDFQESTCGGSASRSFLQCLVYLQRNTDLPQAVHLKAGVMVESNIERTSLDPSYYYRKEDHKENGELYEKLQHVLKERENLKQRVYQESCRHQNTERDLAEALQKAQASENLYLKELKQKNEIEEKLARAMIEVERLTKQTHEISAALQNEREQKLALEKRNLMLQRDNALREAEVLRLKKGEPTANSQGIMNITEFSYSEIKEATDNFNCSLKIGEGVYGSVYKGFMRHTTVAIKRLSPASMQSRSQFNQEVEILSRVRHPNLVTLIGACQEAQALVYEFMPNGSLDDRLACKDKTKPLSWQLRTRIASEICSALIFLHSNRPHSMVHSDLKASNILLDENHVSKLSGFGGCRMLTDEFKTNTTLYRHTHPKGSFVYMDPEYLISGDLTAASDVYSFGIILLRLLTGRSGLGLLKDVQKALDKGCFQAMLDTSAGDWPVMQAEELARIVVRCCEIRRKNRPDLRTEVWTILEPMMKSASIPLSCSSFKSVSEDLSGVPSYFICPIFQDIMREPLIAADGFTYEAEAIKEWFDSGHLTSPMTNLELPHCELTPNHALRSAIREWLQAQA